MLNSFIIKNADTSFDVYYSQMKKRKQIQQQNSMSMGYAQTQNTSVQYSSFAEG